VNKRLKRCEHCHKEFEFKRASAKYCSPYCRKRASIERNPERNKLLKKEENKRAKEKK